MNMLAIIYVKVVIIIIHFINNIFEKVSIKINFFYKDYSTVYVNNKVISL